MKLKCFSIGTLGLLAVSGLAWSCSNKAEDCDANLNCGPYGGGAPGTSGASGLSGASGTGAASGTSGTSGEGGTDPSSAGSGGAPPPPCDGSLSPDMDACVISDEYGIFVSPDGDDASADGTQAHPFAKLTSALGSESIANKHVYVCAADYAEPGIIEIPDRVSIYGGFSCDGGNWKYDSPFPAHLLPASAIGATITDAKVGVVLQDVRLDAADAPAGNPGGSSFGLIVNDSQGVVLRRVEIRAGKATAGTDGVAGAVAADGVASSTEQNGSAACSATPKIGVGSMQSTCASKGGDGGPGYLSLDGDRGQPGIPAENLIAPGMHNGGAGATESGVNKAGTRGGDGLGGKPGVNGSAAATVGQFSGASYLAASGGDGTDGYPGQGGGGGGASKGNGTCAGAAGGAGGMGGCGGHGGRGGTGGGASIAVLSVNSMLTIDGSILTAAAGGAGGNGGAASIGGQGVTGGSGGMSSGGSNVGKGGSGGDGGIGGNGGNGAGGSGGPSIALSWSGTKPAQLGTCHLNVGEGGKAGLGGRQGPDSTIWGPDGQPGAAEPIFPKDAP